MSEALNLKFETKKSRGKRGLNFYSSVRTQWQRRSLTTIFTPETCFQVQIFDRRKFTTGWIQNYSRLIISRTRRDASRSFKLGPIVNDSISEVLEPLENDQFNCTCHKAAWWFQSLSSKTHSLNVWAWSTPVPKRCLISTTRLMPLLWIEWGQDMNLRYVLINRCRRKAFFDPKKRGCEWSSGNCNIL